MRDKEKSAKLNRKSCREFVVKACEEILSAIDAESASKIASEGNNGSSIKQVDIVIVRVLQKYRKKS